MAVQFLTGSSSLEHHNHPPLEEEATLLSQKDLSDKDEQLTNILCDANVPPGVCMNSLMYKLPNSFITGHLCFS